MTTQPDAPADDTQPTDQPDTGPVPGAAGEDVGRTFDLSDEAAAALYPDVESGEPPQIDPADLQVPPPFAQRESALLDIIRMYGSKQASWPDTLKALVDFEYAPMPQPAGAPIGPNAGQWYGDVENEGFSASPPNTWPQLQEAADAGLITQVEFDQVLAARAGQTDTQATDQGGDSILAAAGDGGNTGGSAALPPGPGEGKAWSDAARTAAHEARLRHLLAMQDHAREVLHAHEDDPDDFPESNALALARHVGALPTDGAKPTADLHARLTEHTSEILDSYEGPSESNEYLLAHHTAAYLEAGHPPKVGARYSHVHGGHHLRMVKVTAVAPDGNVTVRAEAGSMAGMTYDLTPDQAQAVLVRQ